MNKEDKNKKYVRGIIFKKRGQMLFIQKLKILRDEKDN